MSMSYFSTTELAAFERDGFVFVRNLFNGDQMNAITSAVGELAERPPTRGREMVYLEDSQRDPSRRILSRIENFLDFHDDLRALALCPQLVTRVDELLGEKSVLFKDKINFKLPGGDGFAAHQDIQPGWDDYAPYFISVLITIDDSTLDNGCLELAAGHHRRGMLGEHWQPLRAEQLDGVDFKPFPTAAGDAVFFDCFVPHRSAPNLTGTARRNLYLTFNRHSDGDHRQRYFADKRKSYPPDCEREEGREYRFRV